AHRRRPARSPDGTSTATTLPALSARVRLLGRLFRFFFQAEDGIRDFHVTGVQTCALPISNPFFLSIQHPTFSSASACGGQSTRCARPDQWLRHPDSTNFLQTLHSRQPLLFLRIRPTHIYRAHRQAALNAQKCSDRWIDTTKFASYHPIHKGCSSCTSVTLVHIAAYIQLSQFRDELKWKFVFQPVLIDQWLHFCFQRCTNLQLQGTVLRRKPFLHIIKVSINGRWCFLFGAPCEHLHGHLQLLLIHFGNRTQHFSQVHF